MKLITTDIAIEAVVKFMKRNYHKFTRLEILFVELYKEHVVIVASVKHSRNDTDDGLIPWGTPAQREAAEQALVRHFAY